MQRLPIKIHRNVLKAVNTLVDDGEFIERSEIVDQVKQQMQKLSPVPNIDKVIGKSLMRLAQLGLLERSKNRKQFAMRHAKELTNILHYQDSLRRKRASKKVVTKKLSTTKKVGHPKVTKRNKKTQAKGTQNKPRVTLSEESLSGSEYSQDFDMEQPGNGLSATL